MKSLKEDCITVGANMEQKSFNITLYGFWDDFGRRLMPQSGKVYFIFAGQIIEKNLCHILRTLYIGSENPEKVSSDFSNKILPGELFFYAIGDTRDVEIDALIYSLRKEFVPTLIDADTEDKYKRQIFKVHIDGKIPNIYEGKSDFEIKPEGEK